MEFKDEVSPDLFLVKRSGFQWSKFAGLAVLYRSFVPSLRNQAGEEENANGPNECFIVVLGCQFGKLPRLTSKPAILLS